MTPGENDQQTAALLRGDDSPVVSIVIPGAPIGKGRPRFYRGRAVTPAATRNYEQAIAVAGLEAARRHGPFAANLALSMRVEARMPIPESWSARKRECAICQSIWPTGRPDGDNLLKAAADALNGVLYRDDAQLVEQYIRKVYHPNPALLIELRPV